MIQDPKKAEYYDVSGRLHYRCLEADCPANCCGPYHGEGDRFQSALGVESHEIPVTDEDYSRLIGAGREDLAVRLADGQMYLKLRPDGACTALEDSGRCSIHQIRPSSCRCFPFDIDKYMGLSINLRCPGLGEGPISADETDAMLDALRRVYLHRLAKLPLRASTAVGDAEKAES